MSTRFFLHPMRNRLFTRIFKEIELKRRYCIHFGILQEKYKKTCFKSQLWSKTYSNPTGTPGSGAGRGGGAGGSVRESGGGLGQYGAAQEEQFFYNKQREQLEKLKKKLKEGKGELSQKEEK